LEGEKWNSYEQNADIVLSHIFILRIETITNPRNLYFTSLNKQKSKYF
jgi:hypothetical protein